MKQVTTRSVNSKKKGKPKPKKPINKKPHPQYGTSKLEEDFARDFLDRLGIQYQYQFEAVDIGRFFDFYIPKSNLIIEIDGDYWHGNPNIYEEGKLKYHQKKAQIIDDYKEKWAVLHGIPIIRFWESDIRKNPSKVMKELKERLYIEDSKRLMLEKKNKRHNNKL